MGLEHLRIDGVRCLNEVALDLDPSRNYFWGPNGAGKTSCLEAIFLLSRGRSFRTRQTARLVRHGSDRLSVFGRIRDAEGRLRRLGVEFAAGRLTGHVDGEPVKTQAEMLRLFPVHVIDPRLHQLVEAGPSERRRYLDSGVFHVEHRFLEDWRHYRRVLGQRNAALKAGGRPGEIDVWTEPFLAAASAVDTARAAYVERLATIAAGHARALLGHELRLSYRAGWGRGIGLREALEQHADGDRSAGFTQVGPHRADLRLDFDVGGVRETASRGQQKLVAAALVIAQVSLFEERTRRSSTILVDDASAELDATSQSRLEAALGSLRSQLLLTGLTEAALNPLTDFPVFHVEQGRIRPVL